MDELCIEAFTEVEKNVSLTLDNFGLYHRKEMVSLMQARYMASSNDALISALRSQFAIRLNQ